MQPILKLIFLVVLLNFFFLQKKFAQQKEKNVFRNTSDYIEVTHIVPRLKSRFAENQCKPNIRIQELVFLLVLLSFNISRHSTHWNYPLC